MGSVGEYGWSGAAGTTFWVDPKEQLVGIYMVQASADDTRFLRNQFRSMVQAAIVFVRLDAGRMPDQIVTCWIPPRGWPASMLRHRIS